MKLKNKAKKDNYPDIDGGDTVRIPIIHKTPIGFKQQWSTELYTVQSDSHNGIYMADNQLYPRKELQFGKGDVVKSTRKSQARTRSNNQSDGWSGAGCLPCSGEAIDEY